MTDLAAFLPRNEFDRLLDALRADGYRCVGPRSRDGAIVYDEIDSSADLPRRVHDQQAPGRYRLTHSDSPRWFAWANGPQAIKPLTFAPRETLWRSRRDAAGGFHFSAAAAVAAKTAVIGVRACDLAAWDLQRRHFGDDARFQARSDSLLVIAVHCSHPAATCFCHATGDGPAATRGHDIALHELDDGFLLTSASDAGAAIAARLPLRDSSAAQRRQAAAEIDGAIAAQQRSLPSRNLRDALFARLDHPRWEAVAQRCLACGNCTAVCPSCFCHRQHDEASLDGGDSEHLREWDSCFTSGHSHIHGIVIRADTASRYRQWLTHKLGSWHDQYGRSGCVGCGRCISWCPAGIDLTEEVHAIVAD